MRLEKYQYGSIGWWKVFWGLSWPEFSRRTDIHHSRLLRMGHIHQTPKRFRGTSLYRLDRALRILSLDAGFGDLKQMLIPGGNTIWVFEAVPQDVSIAPLVIDAPAQVARYMVEGDPVNGTAMFEAINKAEEHARIARLADFSDIDQARMEYDREIIEKATELKRLRSLHNKRASRLREATARINRDIDKARRARKAEVASLDAVDELRMEQQRAISDKREELWRIRRAFKGRAEELAKARCALEKELRDLERDRDETEARVQQECVTRTPKRGEISAYFLNWVQATYPHSWKDQLRTPGALWAGLTRGKDHGYCISKGD